MGTCRYLLSGVREGAGTSDMPWFAVEVQHRRAWNTLVAMTEHVWLHLMATDDDGAEVKYTIYMKIATPSTNPQAVATEIIEQRGDVSSTMVTNEMSNDLFTMVNYGGRVEVTTWFGVKVEYSARGWSVDVHIPECYANNMEGLCGDYNGDKTDEYIVRDGTDQTDVATWGQSWKTANEGGDCEAGPTDFPVCTNQQVLADCGAIHSVFSQCADTDLPVDTFFDNCVFDVCLDNQMKCPQLGLFAQTCFRELTGVMTKDSSMCDWASQLGCTPDCGANSVYSGCADSCRDTRTCGNRDASVADCPANGRFVSMCVCMEGFVLENGQCILEADCGCQTPKGGSVANGYQSETCEEVCTCTAGIYECKTREGCISGCGQNCHCMINGGEITDGQSSDNCEEHCECKDGVSECIAHPEGTIIDGCETETATSTSTWHGETDIADWIAFGGNSASSTHSRDYQSMFDNEISTLWVGGRGEQNRLIVTFKEFVMFYDLRIIT